MLTPSSIASANSVKFETETMNVVKVENLSPHMDIGEIVSLFTILIGGVKGYNYYENGSSGHLEIAFIDQIFASKALYMSGYTIQGTIIIVSLVPPLSRNIRPKQQTDDRRNLYVLGLPFSLTKAEFSGVFSRFGTVTHCVILATVDNSSRRRGFVVMATHEEAKLAMLSLTRTQINGYCLDISWAVVQRSGGFLDGGDRAIPPDSRPLSRCPSPALQKGLENASFANLSFPVEEHDLSSLVLSVTPTATLLVTNLPTFLFAQTRDMQPLFYPFGHIKKLSLIGTSTSRSTSVIVEYEAAAIAQEAKEFLHGQTYADYEITIHFVRSQSLASSDISLAPRYNMNALSAFAHQPLLGTDSLPRYNYTCYSTGLRASPRRHVDYTSASHHRLLA